MFIEHLFFLFSAATVCDVNTEIELLVWGGGGMDNDIHCRLK